MSDSKAGPAPAAPPAPHPEGTRGTLRYKWMPAKHFTPGRRQKIRSILLHATEGSRQGDIDTLVGGDGRQVSVHWYITRDGGLYHFVQNGDTANHAGPCRPPYSNAASIGIEHEHIDGRQDWPLAQIQAAANLCAFLEQSFGTLEIVYHKDVAVPAGRKSDPQGYPRALFDSLLLQARKKHWSAEAI